MFVTNFSEHGCKSTTEKERAAAAAVSLDVATCESQGGGNVLLLVANGKAPVPKGTFIFQSLEYRK